MDFEELICSVCSQYFDDETRIPRMVPRCGHTFCTKCIEDIIESNSSASDKLFCCPEDKFILCFFISEFLNRVVMHLSSSDVIIFPKNFLLARLVKKRANLISPREKLVPQVELQVPSNNTKLTSSNLFSSTTESQGELSRYSSKSNLLQQETGPMNLCFEHGRPFEIVCLEDRCRICSSCALFGAHRNHEIKPEGEVLKEIAEGVDHLIDIFQTIQKQERTIVEDNSAEILQKKLKERQDELAKIIQEKFNEYITLLKNQEKHLLEDLNKRFSAVREKLNNSKQVPHDLQERLKKWKFRTEEILNKISEKSQKGEIDFELLDCMDSTKNDILLMGERLAYELKQTKEIPFRAFESEASKLSVTFSSNLPQIINILCQITEANENNETTIVHDSSHRDSYNQSSCKSSIQPQIDIKELACSEVMNGFASSKRHLLASASTEARSRKSFGGFEFERYGKDHEKENTPPNKPSKHIRFISPINKFGLTLENKKSDEDSDLLNFEINDLTLGEIFESDCMAKVSHPKDLTDTTNTTKNRFTIFSQEKNIDLDVIESFDNLSRRNSNNKIYFQEEGRGSLVRSRIGEGYSLNEFSKTPRSSVSPMSRNNRDDQLSKSMRFKKRGDIQVAVKYEPVIEGIKSNTIETADLTGADLGDQGIYKLAEYLKDNTKLRSLKLLKNKISDDGGIALVNALFYNKALQTLNLTQNVLTEKTVDAFMNLFKVQRSIRTIYFNQNSISLRNVKTKIKEMTTMGVNKINLNIQKSHHINK